MNYLTFGRVGKPVLVFLHGWGGSLISWISTAEAMARIGFYCIVVDFPGFGQTPEPKTVYGVADYAKEVEDLIWSLGIGELSVIGHSFGGRVAIALSNRTNVKIKKLVLVDSAGVIPRRGFRYWYKVKKYKRIKKFVEDGKLPMERLKLYGSKDYQESTAIMKRTFVKVVNEDLLPVAKKVQIPTLLVWGSKDKDTPMYMAKKLHRAINNSQLVVYNAGHYSYLDNFSEFIEDLYAFMIC